MNLTERISVIRHRHSKILLVLAGLTCLTAGARAQELPRVSQIWVTQDVDAAPLNNRTSLAVSSSGSVLFRSYSGSDEALFVADSSGRITSRFGTQGDGPGEVRDPQPIAERSGEFVTWDPGTRRLSRWSQSGALVSENRFLQTVRPILPADRGFLGVERGGRGSTWQPVRIAEVDGAWNYLLSSADANASTVAANPTGLTVEAIFGAWAGGFVIIDPNIYSIGFFDWRGQRVAIVEHGGKPELPTPGRIDAFFQSMPRLKDMPAAQQAQMRETASKMLLPLVAPGSPPQVDGKGRMWVFGYAGDNAFADLFRGQTFLGRIAVACRAFQGSFSVRGSYMAVSCFPDDDGFDGDAVIKLFRIEG